MEGLAARRLRGARSVDLRLAGEVHRPVCLPSRSSVGGECLFPVRRIGCRYRPEEPYQNRPSCERIVRIERADAVLKVADHWGLEASWVATVEPPYRPSSCLCVECAEGDCKVRIAGELELVIVYIAQAAKDLLGYRRAAERDPVIAANQSFFQPAMSYSPFAYEKVKVAGSCLTRSRGHLCSFLSVKWF